MSLGNFLTTFFWLEWLAGHRSADTREEGNLAAGSSEACLSVSSVWGQYSSGIIRNGKLRTSNYFSLRGATAVSKRGDFNWRSSGT